MGTDSFGEEIVMRLLKGERVVIPNLGYLEQKELGSRKTVLFKPLKPQDPLMKELSSQNEEFTSLLFKNISAQLLESQTVTLAQLGVFNSLKNADGSLRVSFAPSPGLRRQLSGEPEPEAASPLKLSVQAEKINTGVHGIAGQARNDSDGVNGSDIVVKEEKPATPVVAPEFKPPIAGVRRITDTKEIAFKQKDRAVSYWDQIKQPLLACKKVPGGWKWIVWGAVLIALVIALAVMVSHRDASQPSDRQKMNYPDETVSLPALAAQAYGDPSFWVYIYEANREQLLSPLQVPVGTELVVPDLAAMQIDVKDSFAIRKAQTLSNALLEQKLLIKK